MEEPLNIAICEDSPEDRQTLLSILESCTVPNCPAMFESGEALLDNFRPGRYDLVLSDIYMGGITGVEAITRLRSIDENVPVAFVTSSQEFALESYRLSALKYIEKPYRQRDIEDILLLAKMKRDSGPSLLVHRSGREEAIRFDRILYLEQRTHHLAVILEDGQEILVYEKLSGFSDQLEKNGFFSSHKSFSVNLSKVESIDRDLKCFVLSNATNIPIRRESMAAARRAFENNLFRKTREDMV